MSNCTSKVQSSTLSLLQGCPNGSPQARYSPWEVNLYSLAFWCHAPIILQLLLLRSLVSTLPFPNFHLLPLTLGTRRSSLWGQGRYCQGDPQILHRVLAWQGGSTQLGMACGPGGMWSVQHVACGQQVLPTQKLDNPALLELNGLP